MSVAEKLLTVAENTPKVCEVVNSALSIASGEVVAVNDVAAVEHDAVVRLRSKNLAKQQTGFKSYGGSVTDTVIQETTGSHITSLVEIVGGETYTLSKENSTDGGLSWRWFFYDKYPVLGETVSIDGNYYPPTEVKVTITAPENAKYLFVVWTGDNDNYPCGWTQIEQGSSATDYAPYIEDFSGVEVTRLGKNWFCPHSAGGGYIAKSELLSDYTVKVTGNSTTSDGGYAEIPMSLKAGTYTFSYKVLEHTQYEYRHGLGYKLAMMAIWGKVSGMEIVGNYMSCYDKNTTYKRTFTLAEDRSTVYVALYPYCKYGEYAIFQIQIERGSTATDYEQPVEPTTYTATTDGTVEGIKSLSPNMTLYTDTDGAIIDCRYFPQGQENGAETFTAIKDRLVDLRERIGGDTDVR